MALIKALGLEGKRICVVIGNEDIEAFLSFRNIPEVNILPAVSYTHLDVYKRQQRKPS